MNQYVIWQRWDTTKDVCSHNGRCMKVPVQARTNYCCYMCYKKDIRLVRPGCSPSMACKQINGIESLRVGVDQWLVELRK